MGSGFEKAAALPNLPRVDDDLDGVFLHRLGDRSRHLLEAEAGLFLSMISVLRLKRLGNDVDDLRATRADLVEKIRELVNQTVDPDTQRMFTQDDFS